MSTRSELKKAVEDARIDYDNALDAHRATQVTYDATRAAWFTSWEAFKDSEDEQP
jgi:hypothetical protein